MCSFGFSLTCSFPLHPLQIPKLMKNIPVQAQAVEERMTQGYARVFDLVIPLTA